jgi:hypothetical protein
VHASTFATPSRAQEGAAQRQAALDRLLAAAR